MEASGSRSLQGRVYSARKNEVHARTIRSVGHGGEAEHTNHACVGNDLNQQEASAAPVKVSLIKLQKNTAAPVRCTDAGATGREETSAPL